MSNFGAGTNQGKAFQRAMAMFQSRVGFPQGNINNSKAQPFLGGDHVPPLKNPADEISSVFFLLVLSEPKKTSQCEIFR